MRKTILLAVCAPVILSVCGGRDVTIREMATACPSLDQFQTYRQNHYAYGDCVLVMPARRGTVKRERDGWAEVDVDGTSLYVASADLR